MHLFDERHHALEQRVGLPDVAHELFEHVELTVGDDQGRLQDDVALRVEPGHLEIEPGQVRGRLHARHALLSRLLRHGCTLLQVVVLVVVEVVFVVAFIIAVVVEILWSNGAGRLGRRAGLGRLDARQVDLRTLGVAPVEHQRMPDDLRDLALGRFGDGRRDLFGVDLGFTGNLQLYQLVPLERDVERRHDAVGQALVTDLHDRLQLVREQAQVTLLFARQRDERRAQVCVFSAQLAPAKLRRVGKLGRLR